MIHPSSPATLLSVTLGCAAIGWLTGCAAGLLWMHPLVSFGGVMLAVLASIRLAGRRGRVVGMPVRADAAVQGGVA